MPFDDPVPKTKPEEFISPYAQSDWKAKQDAKTNGGGEPNVADPAEPIQPSDDITPCATKFG